MSSSPNSVRRGYVMRPSQGSQVRPARMASDLANTSYVYAGTSDPRLVDPLIEQLVAEAQEKARQEGYAAGHAAGFETGREEGLELMATQQRALRAEDAAERAGRLERLTQLLSSVEDAVVGALDYQAPRVEEMRDTIADMAVEIAESLVGHHLQVEDCAAKDALLRALSQVPRRTTLTVRMHPADVALVEDITGDITEWHIARLVPDLEVDRGDAYAEADNLEVEASLTGAMERVRKVLHP